MAAHKAGLKCQRTQYNQYDIYTLLKTTLKVKHELVADYSTDHGFNYKWSFER